MRKVLTVPVAAQGKLDSKQVPNSLVVIRRVQLTYEFIIVKKQLKCSSLQRLLRTTSANTQMQIGLSQKMILLVQQISKMSLCCEVISSFVIVAVLDMHVCGCRL